MHAAAEGQYRVVRILLQYGADPDLKDADGETARMFAIQNGHTAVAELLGSK
jgi:ankyrin repeat protein